MKMQPGLLITGSTREDISISQASIDGSNSVNDELNSVLNENKLAVEEVDAGMGSFGNEENSAPIGDGHLLVSKQKIREGGRFKRKSSTGGQLTADSIGLNVHKNNTLTTSIIAVGDEILLSKSSFSF
ncbi:uncharacterized protein LOC131622975 isoform X2 [Vicia villosa]|uniref:uncharacterized protein LOC131622975 isoform X2 n=1 Tax=Vicia villosa TaxID=3911 RepID=UPI00273B77F7|nr:uncharacterized protein LOC131622975 isoform X2 [Vicia villosa]